MKAGITLRIGILLLGVYALMTTVTNGAYYVLSLISTFDGEVGFFVQTMIPKVIAYFLLPLVFAFWAFAFSDRTVRFLIGRAADDQLGLTNISERALFVTGLQILATYFIVDHGASCVSYFTETFIHRARDTLQPDPRVVADFAYSLAGLVGGLVLFFRASWIETKASASNQALQTTPVALSLHDKQL